MITIAKRNTSWISIAAIIALIGTLFTLNARTDAASAAANIVDPKQTYTYEIMLRDIKALVKAYPDLMAYRSIGKSEYGRDLWELKVGSGPVKIMLNGSHHAREWISTITLMELAENLGQWERSGALWEGIRMADLLDHVTFYFVPMVNPDGVTLQQKGTAAFPKQDRAALIKMNKGSANFKRWKANAKGVDLNRQYPANWEGIKNPAPGPSYMNYKGKVPLQAKEAKAMAQYARALKPEIAVSYHSSGEYVFWNYKTPAANVERDYKIASAYSAMTGYRMMTPEKNPSGGGFTDWFIQEFRKPALTPELGKAAGETNVPLSAWDRIWKQQRYVPWLLGDLILTDWMEGQQAKKAEGRIQLESSAASYASPDLGSKKTGALPEGIYDALQTQGSWMQIKTPEGESRWIAKRAALPAPNPAEEASQDSAQPQPSQQPKPSPQPTPNPTLNPSVPPSPESSADATQTPGTP